MLPIAEFTIYEGDTVSWTFALKRGDTLVNLTGASATISIPALGISDEIMSVDAADSEVTYTPSVADSQDEPCFETEGVIEVTYAGGSTESFPFEVTVEPEEFWSVSPTTSTSTSSTTSTSTTTT